MGYEYLLSVSQAYYEKVRPFVLMRDDYKCVVCGKRAKIVHHIDGKTANSKFTNLVTVCKKHHCHTDEMNLIFERITEERNAKMQQVLKKISAWGRKF